MTVVLISSKTRILISSLFYRAIYAASAGFSNLTNFSRLKDVRKANTSSHRSRTLMQCVHLKFGVDDVLPENDTLLQAPTLTTCRIDHYQTPAEVHVSVFAKQVDKTKSTVRIEQSQVGALIKLKQLVQIGADQLLFQVHLDLHMPNSKRFLRTIDLFGPIKTDESKFSILGAKVRNPCKNM